MIGTVAAIACHVHDLTLSHYDARAHLVVARRIVDSIQPGWIQIGAVWLPLPHILNLLPVQIDWLYRTGLSAVALSVAGFVLGSTALWWLVRRATGSTIAAWAAFAVFTAQPDVLYLQATPMTESLLMGFSLLAIAHVWNWVAHGGTGRLWPGALALALACLTRYEAWPIAVATLALSGVVLIRMGVAPMQAGRRMMTLAAYPTAAILAFLVLSRVTTGAWLVTGGFYQIDDSTYQQPLRALGAVLYGARTLNGTLALALGGIALFVIVLAVVRKRQHTSLLVVLALGACITLPAYAFWNGHPFRIRYMVPVTMVLAAVTGLGVGLLSRHRALAAAAVIVVALVERPPGSSWSPIVLEAQRDRSSVLQRMHVTRCLAQDDDRMPILASMESLAPYMQEMSHAGFSIRRYIHEGIGQMWSDSLLSARRHAGWVLIEEQAEGGDVLARRSKHSAEFLDGFERVCEGGGVALYRRSN